MWQLGVQFPYKPTNPHFTTGKLRVKLIRERGWGRGGAGRGGQREEGKGEEGTERNGWHVGPWELLWLKHPA